MQDKEIKYCKNKDCNKPLPDGYKHKYCEACRNKRVVWQIITTMAI